MPCPLGGWLPHLSKFCRHPARAVNRLLSFVPARQKRLAICIGEIDTDRVNVTDRTERGKRVAVVVGSINTVAIINARFPKHVGVNGIVNDRTRAIDDLSGTRCRSERMPACSSIRTSPKPLPRDTCNHEIFTRLCGNICHVSAFRRHSREIGGDIHPIAGRGRNSRRTRARAGSSRPDSSLDFDLATQRKTHCLRNTWSPADRCNRFASIARLPKTI